MMTLHNVQMTAPAAQPHVRAVGTVETVAAVKSADAGDRARNDLSQDAGEFAEERTLEAKKRSADPSEPVGPPPSFSANVLEAERARLKEGEPVESARDADRAGARDAAQESWIEAKKAAEASEAPQATRSTYGGMREDAPRMLDLSR